MRDDGFSLIEIMVVVLVIAILIAIAIPTFLAARQSAQDRQAQSDVRLSLLVARVIYAEKEIFNATDDELEAIEPTLDFDDTIDNADTDTVGYFGTGNHMVAVRQSVTGTYFCIAEMTEGAWVGIYRGYGSDVDDVNTFRRCRTAPQW